MRATTKRSQVKARIPTIGCQKSSHIMSTKTPQSHPMETRIRSSSSCIVPIRDRKLQIKQDDKKAYDKANKVKEQIWRVGDRVLIKDVRIKPNSDRVVTNRPYHSPMRITEIVQKDSDIGKAYKLEREDGGNPLSF